MTNNTNNMSSDCLTIPPSVSWAQTSSHVFLTFNVECQKPDIKIEKRLIIFKGICEPEHKLHEIEILLFAEVDPEQSTQVNKGRYIELVLSKVKHGPFWPSLTFDRKKHHWLKVDFNRWRDEDESCDEIADMNNMFSSKIGDFGSENEKNDDSSDEEEDLPDLELE